LEILVQEIVLGSRLLIYTLFEESLNLFLMG